MQKCEIMLNDLIDSKRTNTNIKATIKHQPQPGNVCNSFVLFLSFPFFYVVSIFTGFIQIQSEETSRYLWTILMLPSYLQISGLLFRYVFILPFTDIIICLPAMLVKSFSYLVEHLEPIWASYLLPYRS